MTEGKKNKAGKEIGCRPNPQGKMKWTASENRHWLEHGSRILVKLFESKGITAYRHDPVWLSWCALVDAHVAGFGDFFTPQSLVELDDKLLLHHRLFNKVTSM